jgi:hypothetical protein
VGNFSKLAPPSREILHDEAAHLQQQQQRQHEQQQQKHNEQQQYQQQQQQQSGVNTANSRTASEQTMPPPSIRTLASARSDSSFVINNRRYEVRIGVTRISDP